MRWPTLPERSGAAMARWIVEEGLSIDACSEGELVFARAAGFPAERIVLHCSAKTARELSAAPAPRTGPTSSTRTTPLTNASALLVEVSLMAQRSRWETAAVMTYNTGRRNLNAAIP